MSTPSHLDFWRYDFGWKNPYGNFGLLKNHGPDLPGEEVGTLVQWADSTRESFGEHWFCIPVGQDKRALMRVSPLSGGMRGIPSTVQVLVWRETDDTGLIDLASLVDAFPPPPFEIALPSGWDLGWTLPLQPAHEASFEELTARVCLIDGMKQSAPSISYLPMDLARSPLAEMRFLLRVYGLTTLYARKNFQPVLATSNAPQSPGKRYVPFVGMDVTRFPPLLRVWRVAADMKCLRSQVGDARKFDRGAFVDLPSLLMEIAENILQFRIASDFGPKDAACLVEFCRRLAAFDQEITRAWRKAIESVVMHQPIDLASDRLRVFLDDQVLMQELNFPPSWAHRILVTHPDFDNLNADGFDRNVNELVAQFPNLLLNNVPRLGLPKRSIILNRITCMFRALRDESDARVDQRHAALLKAIMNRMLSNPIMEHVLFPDVVAIMLEAGNPAASYDAEIVEVCHAVYDRMSADKDVIAAALVVTIECYPDSLPVFIRLFPPPVALRPLRLRQALAALGEVVYCSKNRALLNKLGAIGRGDTLMALLRLTLAQMASRT